MYDIIIIGPDQRESAQVYTLSAEAEKHLFLKKKKSAALSGKYQPLHIIQVL